MSLPRLRPHRVPASVLLLCSVILLIGCGGKSSDDRSDFDRLLGWMSGSFSSAAQAARDEAYYDIRLEMWPIWSDRDASTPVRWLYVEQAMAGREEQPYRQRVYRLRPLGDGRFESAVFTLPGPERFVGAWREPSAFASLTPDSLAEREGCALVLRVQDDGSFRGATADRSCPSDLRGARWATSEAHVFAEGLDTWDRGFDAAGAQVWGATEGPYEFRRRLP